MSAGFLVFKCDAVNFISACQHEPSNFNKPKNSIRFPSHELQVWARMGNRASRSWISLYFGRFALFCWLNWFHDVSMTFQSLWEEFYNLDEPHVPTVRKCVLAATKKSANLTTAWCSYLWNNNVILFAQRPNLLRLSIRVTWFCRLRSHRVYIPLLLGTSMSRRSSMLAL